MLSLLAVGREHLIALENIQYRQCRAAGQGVARVGMGVQEAARHFIVVERLVNVVARQGNGQRQVTSGYALGQTQDVRADIRLFACQKTPGAAESDRYFVGDQMHIVAIAQLSDFAQKTRVVHGHAASGLNQGFDNEGCRVGMLCGQIRLQRTRGPPGNVFGFLAGAGIAPIRRSSLGARSQ